MKELVKTLIDQAMVPSGLEGLGGPHLELDPEKLVELVVKECVAQICPEGAPNEAAGGDISLYLAAERIEAHFGI